MLPLSQLEVLVVDCQATAASPRGHLLELGWVQIPATIPTPHALLIRLPGTQRVPPAVARITGISDAMLRGAVDGEVAWREFSAHASRLSHQPAPAVAHFARFERPFLHALAGGAAPLDLVCTHAIARRLLPDLPRCTLRALTGYFGGGVGTLRRSADHVAATAFVWRELVRLLDARGISTWSALQDWLAAPARAPRRTCRVWPMPRELRLSLPDAPGIYRMLRTSGDVLYVGKAASLHHRVNSYFRHQHGVPERLLEMLSQARAVSVDVTASALEAALLEPDEIKRHRPPYNIALTSDERHVWFTAADLSGRSPHPGARCPLGPFPSAETLDQFAALARGSRESLGRGRWAPDDAAFEAGFARFRAAHREWSRADLGIRSKLLCLGTRLWLEGRRDRDQDDDVPERTAPAWTPEQVQMALERLALRAALARRRARWLTRLAEASIVWSEPRAGEARLIIVQNGDAVLRASVACGTTPAIPPGHLRPAAERHQAMTIASFDRLRVLTTELKRLVSEGAPVEVRLCDAPALAGVRLARALSWV